MKRGSVIETGPRLTALGILTGGTKAARTLESDVIFLCQTIGKENALAEAFASCQREGFALPGVIGQLDQYIGDTFIEYRLRKLIGKAVFEAEGDWNRTAFYKIKLR